MTKIRWTRARVAGLAGIAALSLAACGGGGGAGDGNFFPVAAASGNVSQGGGSQSSGGQSSGGQSSGQANGNQGNGNQGSQPVALQPLAGGTQYAGTASFGDTVSITLDQPAAGKLTLRFVDSRFGLSGAVTASYATQPDGSLLAGNFAAVAGSGVPDALAAALPRLGLRFQLDGSLLSGSLSQVPNLKAGNGAVLQGEIAASNQGVADVSRLAGVYNYIKRTAAYDPQGGQVGAPASEHGQFGIKADGTVRACIGQAYADNCAGGRTGLLAAEADQKTYPGAMALTLDGQRIGRVMVNAQSGAATLLADEFATTAADGSFRTGTWVLQSATAAIAAMALDGEWLCSQPELDASSGALTGRTQRNFVSIGASLLQTDTIDTDVKLSANAGGMNGIVAGQWSDNQKPARVLLPVGKQTAYYIGTGASTGSAAASSISGVCRALPVQPVSNTYAGFEVGSAMDIRIGDAHPTQPAIGYDQIYYKQGRYRKTDKDSTGKDSTQWKKAFDDYCETVGLSDGAKGSTVIAGTSLLNDPTTFACSTKNAFSTAGLKTAVVGPRGVLYLTDGHHTLTSLWEAPYGGGPDIKVKVVKKGQFMDLNNASFWRTMRQQKFVWLKLPDGSAITPAELPQQLGLGNGLKDDPYRALLYFTRDIGYKQPANSTEFLEFYWSEWLQAAPQSLKLSAYKLTDATSYLQAIQAASVLMNATPDTTIIGSSGLTAVQMGKLATFDTATFNDLNTPTTADKPGKLAYALSYRASLAVK